MSKRRGGPRGTDGIPWLESNAKGVYAVHWYDQDSQHTRRLSLRTRDAGTAQGRYAAFLIEAGKEGGPLSDNPEAVFTVNMALDAYWDDHVEPNVVDKGRMTIATRHIRQHFGELPVKDITIEHARAYAKARRAGEIGRPSVDSTIRRELGGTLTPAISHAVKWKLMSRADVPYIELTPKGEPKDRWLTKTELGALLTAATETKTRKSDGTYGLGRPEDGRMTRCYRFCLAAYMTAGRRSAIEQLSWFQFDWEAMLINLKPRGRRQTKKRRPIVPIFNEFLPFVERARKEKVSEFFLDSPGEIRTSFDSAVKRAGLKDVTPHTLRHTRATHLLQDGVDIYTVAKLLGDTIQTVEETYGHHCPDQIRDKIDGFFNTNLPDVERGLEGESLGEFQGESPHLDV